MDTAVGSLRTLINIYKLGTKLILWTTYHGLVVRYHCMCVHLHQVCIHLDKCMSKNRHCSRSYIHSHPCSHYIHQYLTKSKKCFIKRIRCVIMVIIIPYHHTVDYLMLNGSQGHMSKCNCQQYYYMSVHRYQYPQYIHQHL